MNGELYQITVEQMKQLISSADVDTISDSDMMWTLKFAERSDPLLAGIYDGELVCLVGLIPNTMLSDTAYLWVYTTKAIQRHKTKYARHVQRWLRSQRIRYDYLTGHCLIDDHTGQTLVKWLGADFGEASGPLIPFIFRRI